MVRELIPWVHEHYHVTSNPAETIVGGGSRGGLAAAFAGLRHSEIFGNVLSVSGEFSWDPKQDQTIDKEDLEFEWIIRQYAETPKLPLHFTLTGGLLDFNPEFPNTPSSLQSNRHMRDVLLAKGYTVSYREIGGGDEVFTAAVALPDDVLSILGARARDKGPAAH